MSQPLTQLAITGSPLRVPCLKGAQQGEGAIEGSFKEYQVPWASTHDTFVHSRFACDAP